MRRDWQKQGSKQDHFLFLPQPCLLWLHWWENIIPNAREMANSLQKTIEALRIGLGGPALGDFPRYPPWRGLQLEQKSGPNLHCTWDLGSRSSMEENHSDQGKSRLCPRSANFLKAPDSKHFRLTDHVVKSLTKLLCSCSWKAAIDNTWANGGGYGTIQLNLQTQAAVCWNSNSILTHAHTHTYTP